MTQISAQVMRQSIKNALHLQKASNQTLRHGPAGRQHNGS
jgi:hypothetical protein